MFRKKTLILGVGNLQCGDEGFGIHVVRRLAAQLDNPEVELLEGGPMGLSLLPHLERRQGIIVAESLNFGGQPGDLLKLRASDLAHFAERGEAPRILRDVMAAMERGETQPAEFWVFLCQPAGRGPGETLSAPVQAAVGQMAANVLEFLQQRS